MAGIVLSIEVDDKGTVKVKQFSDETKKAFDEMKKGPAQAQGPLNSLRDSWIGITAKITAATAVVYGITRAFSSFVDEAAEAEQIENRLKYRTESLGYSWQYAKSAVDEFAASQQASTRFSDEQARGVLYDLLLYTQDYTKALQGSKVAMNLVAGSDLNLQSASRLVGMAMSGNVEMLGRYIPELRNLDERLGANATQAQKAEYAMKILNEKFGGTAQADLNSYTGQLAQFRNQWAEIKEQIGTHFLPVLKEVVTWFAKGAIAVAEFFGAGGEKVQLNRQLEAIESKLNEAARLIAESGVPPEIHPAYKSLVELERERQDILEKIKSLNLQEIENKRKLAEQTKKDIFIEKAKQEEIKKLSPTEEILRQLKAEEEYYKEAAERTIEIRKWEDSQIVASKISATEEILRELKAEEEYYKEVAEREIEIRKWEAENAGKAAAAGAEGIKGAADMGETLAKNMGDAWNFNLKNIVTESKSMGDAVRNVFYGMADSFTSAVSKMISDWLLFGSITGEYKAGKGFIGMLGSLLPFAEGGIVQGWRPLTEIPNFQHGAVVNQPTLAMVGEGGEREFIIPESKMGSGKTIINAFYIYANDPISFRDFVRRNPESIIELINKDSRAAGATRGIIKNVG